MKKFGDLLNKFKESLNKRAQVDCENINLRLGLVDIFYNKDYGFIIVPYRVGFPNLAIEPVITCSFHCSNQELVENIFKCIEVSKQARKTEMKDLNNKDNMCKFWLVGGIKGYGAFIRKFKNICIEISEFHYDIAELIHGKEGSCTQIKTIKVEKNLSDQEFGEIILSLVNDDNNKIEDKEIKIEREFVTFNETKVTYIQLSDEFVDRGDGGTDCYQIFANEEYEDNYIAFLIDMGYFSFNIDEIKLYFEKKKSRYDNLCIEEFEDKITVEYKMESKYVTRQLYKDGNGVLEVMYEIDTINTPINSQKNIEQEFKSVVASLNIGGI